MAIERRASATRRYWYRASRTGKRVVKNYVGPLSDPIVQIAYRHERLAMATYDAATEDSRREARNHDAIAPKLVQYHKQWVAVLQYWLLLQGIRLSSDGRWHHARRKGNKDETMKAEMTRDEFEALVAAAEDGDAQARQKIRMTMFDHPETWAPFGDLTGHVKRHYIKLITGGAVIAEESLRVTLAEMTRGLRGSKPCPIRGLAIEEVVINFLHLRYQQLLAATPRETEFELDRVERRLNVARKRYQSALESLGRIDAIAEFVLSRKLDGVAD